MMKRWLFVFIILFVAVMSVNAVPAMRGIWKVLKLVDGTEVRAELRGDEHFHYWRSAEGKMYVESGQDGVYKLIDENAFNSRARAVQARATMLESAKSKLPESVLVSDKTHRGLVILVDYPDEDENGKRTLQFQEEHTKEYYEWITNTKTSLMPSVEGQKLIDAGYAGSVFDYFYTQSNGKFSIQFDVVGPYTLSQKQEFYGHNDVEKFSDDPQDMFGAMEMVIEACELAATDPDVDFANYDWDNDDILDLVYVIYAGLGESFGGEDYSVWPQSFDFTYDKGDLAGTLATTYNVKGIEHSLLFGGKNLNICACSSEIEKDAITEELTGGAIGTICHEFSHCLGLMDHYVMNDPNYKDDSKAMCALRNWDIMDYGSYNGGGKIPAGYNSFEKAYLGWREPIEVDEVGSVKVSGLRPYSENGHAYKVKNHANENEYYLIENRQKTGWDKALPGSGVLITHMDYDEGIYNDNNINNANDRLRFKVIPADNKDTRDTQEDDTYPYSTFFSIFKNDRLDDTSSPSNKVYHPNIDGSNHLGYSIKNIYVSEDGLASFDIISKFESKDMLEVTKLSIDNWNLYEGVIDGSYLEGSLTIQNNDIVRKKAEIKLWLVDQQTKEVKSLTIPVFIKAGKPETYDFSFKNMIIGHEYSIIALYSTGAVFFTSAPLLCSNGGSDETVEGNENLRVLEYWFDKDIEEKANVLLNTNNALITASIDASRLSDGIHQLNYRLARNDGMYSSVSSSPFLKLTKEEKGKLEYWFDGNFANRSSVDLSDTEDEHLLTLDLEDADAFPTGYHILNMRTALPGMPNSPICRSGVLKIATGKANTLEYWFNDDIEHRNKIDGESVDGGYLFTSEIDMSSLPDGVHRLYYRAVENKSSLGSAVSVMPVIKVKQGAGYRLEYWFDEATDDRKTLDGSPSDDGESYVFTGSLSLTDLLIGEHTLHYRISADDGRSYSSIFSDNVILKFGPNADVNRDGKINAADIVFVGNVLSKDDVGIDAMNRADADGNGEINKDDIQFIVRIIMAPLD
jgi:M6 family metalloprotease-like protein